jgi:hypothetical protein
MRWLWRYWPWLPPSRAERVAIVIGIALVAAVLVAMIKLPNFDRASNAGFGPDWDCTSIPDNHPVCIKRVPTDPPKGTTPSD